MRLLWTRRAERRLDEIASFIAQENPRAARATLTAIRRKGHLSARTWYCDLRDATSRADRIPLDDFLVNEYLDWTAGAVLEGEVLRYIGDAVFVIFPYQV